MDKKIFFTDIDGTLMNDEKKVPKENKEALHRMLDDGHYVVIASGRAIKSQDVLVEELDLHHPNAYLMCYNGAQIWQTEPKQMLTAEYLDRAKAVKVIEAAKSAGIHIQTYTDTHVLAETMSEGMRYYSRTSAIPVQIVADLAAEMPEQIPKLLLMDFDAPERLIAFRNDHPEFEPDFNIMFSCPEYLEYCPTHSNKGTALAYMRDYLGLPEDSTIAIGDENNDLPMIRAAHLGIAMKNAIPEVKKEASAITEADNNHAGVAWAIRRYVYGEI